MGLKIVEENNNDPQYDREPGGVYYPQCRAALTVYFDGFGNQDSAPQIIHVLPIMAKVHLNGYKEADTFELEFDSRQFPMSPELIRSCAVQIHMFQKEDLLEDDSDYENDFSYVTVVGLIDTAHLHSSEKGQTFRVTGRDYTALLIDKQWNVNTDAFPHGIPLDQAVQRLLDRVSGETASKTGTRLSNSSTLKVKVITEDGLTLPDYFDDDVDKTAVTGKLRIKPKSTRPKKAPAHPLTHVGEQHTKTNAKGIPQKHGRNFWDVIYSVCLAHGFICFVRLNELIISTPRALTAHNRNRLYKMAKGRDIKSLDYERKLGKETVPQIIVRCYDSTNRRPISGKWPTDAFLNAHTRPVTGIGTTKDTSQIVTVNGIKDPQRLVDIAHTMYDHLARSEGKIKITTWDLKDIQSKDLLKIRPGDPIQIGYDAYDNSNLEQKDMSQRMAIMRNLGYTDSVAQYIAQGFDDLRRMRPPFYTKTVTYDWSNTQGMQITIEGINYIAAGRDDAQ